MSQPLQPCPSCQRHVFADACACPFCATKLRVCEAPRSVGPPARQLSRAARLAAGAALMGAGACSSSAVPLYGVPPDASRDVPADAGGDGGDADGALGPLDSKLEAHVPDGGGGAGGTSSPADAGSDRVVVPIYGAAAPVPRKPVP